MFLFAQKHPLKCSKIGNIVRAGKGRIGSLVSDSTGQVLGCHGTDNSLELFYFLPEDQIKHKKSKRLNKLKKKVAKYVMYANIKIFAVVLHMILNNYLIVITEILVIKTVTVMKMLKKSCKKLN